MLLDLGHARPTIVNKEGTPHYVVYLDRTPGKISSKRTKMFSDCLQLLHRNAMKPYYGTYVTLGNNVIRQINEVSMEDFDGRVVPTLLFKNHYLTLTRTDITDYKGNLISV